MSLYWLKNIVNFLKKQLRDIPIIFRPFHEGNIKDNCFWWSKRACSAENYKSL